MKDWMNCWKCSLLCVMHFPSFNLDIIYCHYYQAFTFNGKVSLPFHFLDHPVVPFCSIVWRGKNHGWKQMLHFYKNTDYILYSTYLLKTIQPTTSALPPLISFCRMLFSVLVQSSKKLGLYDTELFHLWNLAALIIRLHNRVLKDENILYQIICIKLFWRKNCHLCMIEKKQS